MRYIKHTFIVMLAMLILTGSMPVRLFADENAPAPSAGDGAVSSEVTDAEGSQNDRASVDVQNDDNDDDEPEEPVEPEEPDPDDPDQPSEDEMEDPSSYEPNPDPPQNANLVAITGIRQVNGKGTHLASFTGGYGEGICCYHKRHYPYAGEKGWMRRMTPGESHYQDIRKVMYWGVYKKNGSLTAANAFSIHIMLSYWRNGNGSLSSGIKEGTSRFKTAKSYCNTLTKKADPPASFQIYEWVGTGSASKRQILITYNVGCYVCIKKSPSATDTDYLDVAPVNYSLKGAVYELYGDASCSVRAKDVNGKDFSFSTDDKGNTSVVAVDPGQYWAKEVKASPGFMLDTTVRPVTVTTSNTMDAPAVIRSDEPPARAGLISLRKEDGTGNKGWKRMLGAEYTLKYYAVDPSTTDVSGLSPERSWTFEIVRKTDSVGKDIAGIDFSEDEPISGDSFYTENGKRVLPLGVFTIEETKAPAGLTRNTAVYYGKVHQPSNGSAAKVVSNIGGEETMYITDGSESDVTNKETPQRIEIVIDKKDASGEANASLAGAEYEVYYDDDELSAPELVGTIVTDEKGYGKLTKREAGRKTLLGDDLTPGKYMIKETKAAPGFVTDRYIFSNGKMSEAPDKTIKVICKYDDDGKSVNKIISGSYDNGTHSFRARSESINTGVFTYIVISEDEPTRTYIKKTDVTDTKEVTGARLQVIAVQDGEEGKVIEEWVSTDKEHLIYALPAGKYILREITAPYGYDVAEDVTFEVKEGQIVHRAEMKNKPLMISTSASSEISGTHHGYSSDEEIITDKVNISGLYAGRVYKVEGCLVDKNTGEKLKDAEGNDLHAEEEFTAAGATAVVDLEFSADTSQFTDETAAVGFERLYRTSTAHDKEDEGKLPLELAKHEDLGNESQSIHYGGIVRTMALDSKGRSKNIQCSARSVIHDYVEFRNLSPEETYSLDAEIYDKTDGKITEITGHLDFKPDAESGTVIVEIRFDGRKLAGHELVAYETLSIGDRIVDTHKDPEDEDQTVFMKSGGSGPDTGDSREWLLYLTVSVLAAVLMIIIGYRKLHRV